MVAGLGIDELRVDPHTLSLTANTAFQDVANAQFARDLLQVDRSAPIREAGIAGDHEQ
jgi:hypothetical protein